MHLCEFMNVVKDEFNEKFNNWLNSASFIIKMNLSVDFCRFFRIFCCILALSSLNLFYCVFIIYRTY